MNKSNAVVDAATLARFVLAIRLALVLVLLQFGEG